MQPNKTILISGGTGLVGSRLSQMLLHQGFRVIVLTRHPEQQFSPSPLLSFARWNIASGFIDPQAIADADVVVHLAGAGIMDKPWTAAYKKEIVASRVQSAKLLVQALKTQQHKVSTFISASAIGYYGADAGGPPFAETHSADAGFVGNTCQQWEDAVQPVNDLGIRLVIARIGIVLAQEGGALPEFKKTLKYRVAAVLGHGHQIMSWIHIEDLCRFFIAAIHQLAWQGVYNVVAPNPLAHQTLMAELAQKQFGKKILTVHVPSFALRMLLGERSSEILKSTTVSAEKLLGAGFRFHYPAIQNEWI